MSVAGSFLRFSDLGSDLLNLIRIPQEAEETEDLKRDKLYEEKTEARQDV